MSKRNPFPFTKCHPGGSVKWFDCTIAQRGLLSLLWSLGDPDKDGAISTIETAGSDVASHLTMRLTVRSDRDRKTTTRTIRELMASGWIVAINGGVQIRADSQQTADTQPADSRHTASAQPADTGQTDMPKPAELLNSASPDRSDDIRLDQIHRARACEGVLKEAPKESRSPVPAEAAGASSLGSLLLPVARPTDGDRPLFRVPLPEADQAPKQLDSAGIEVRRRQLGERICTYIKEAAWKRFKKRATPNASEAQSIAGWFLDGELCEEWQLDSETLAQKGCDGFLADEWAQKNTFPLSAFRKNPQKYLGDPPSAPKPQSVPQRQEHALWSPPAGREEEAVSSEEASRFGMTTILDLQRRRAAAAAAQLGAAVGAGQ